jgi:hypothetical protein
MQMSFLSNVKLSEYNGKELRNPAALRRHKLSEKIEQQLKLVADPNYRPIKTIWNIGEDGTERLFDKPMRIKRWEVSPTRACSVDIVILYGVRMALELTTTPLRPSWLVGTHAESMAARASA